jgi:hypothetical protein
MTCVKSLFESTRLRFVVNVDNAPRVGLRISSNLPKLTIRSDEEAAQ